MSSKLILSLTSIMLVVVILICPMTSLNAAIGIGGIKTLGINTAGATSDPFLSSSRYRGGINGDTLIFHIAQFGRNQPAWFYSYDRGVTWDSAVTMLDNVYSLWYLDYHSNGWFNGNSGFHTAWRYRTSANRPLYRHISAPYTAESMTEPVRQLGLPTDISYYSVVCANDSEQFFLNLMANVESPLIVYHSTNNFETYTRTEPRHFRVTAGGSTQNGMRANIQIGEDGKPTITVLDVGTHAFYRLKWDGSTWDSTMITNNISGLSERGYAYAEMNGKGHLVYMRDSDNKWFHWWESGGTTWTVDTSSSSVNWNGLGAQQLSVINSGANARMYLFYMIQEGINNNIVLKTWTETDGWDVDSTVIVESAQCTWPQSPPYVPADYDSVAVVWKSSATNLVYEINVEAFAAEAGNTIPPNQITNLQIVTLNDSSITLNWTAPGADQDIGSASSYDLRYSLSDITSDNWNLAIPLVGEPIPLSAGTIQAFTVTNLNQGLTYFFAMKSVDESNNWSVLSNVISGTTTTDIIPPAQILNLISSVDIADRAINLSWTAPGDDNLEGIASSYIIKYSQDSVTDSNWDMATSAVGVPTPLPVGAEQTCTISGLDLGVTYFFAIMTGDESNNWSILSNVTSTTTNSIADIIPPNQIVNLFAINGTLDGTINLTWTAPGDDQNIGTASQYDLRYYTSPITTDNWNLTLLVNNEPSPLLSGTIQTFTVSGLTQGMTYYFAMMTTDESDNWSLISNTTSVTINSDITPPAQILNLLSTTGTEDGTINLTWTAPGDDSLSGTANRYIVKYSQDSITDLNWNLAIDYNLIFDPLPTGSIEYLTISGLSSGIVYYVGIKTIDEAGNESPLSNITSAQTYQFVQPSVSIPLVVGYSTAGHALLGRPSYRGGRQGDTLIIVSAQFGSNQTGWTVSYDRGTTWQDIRARWMTSYSGFQTWYSTENSSAWFAGGLHIAYKGYSETDPAGYRYIT